MKLVGVFLVGLLACVAPASQLTLLVLKGCPNSPKMRVNLDAALKSLGMPRNYRVVDLGDLPRGDRRTGFGAPTILLNGVDLFGAHPAHGGSVSCRLYVGGVPSAERIKERLRLPTSKM